MNPAQRTRLMLLALATPLLALALQFPTPQAFTEPERWRQNSSGDLNISRDAAEYIAEKIGEPTKELEQVWICENSIFWSFDRKKYAKANWWKKTASAGIGEKITIRTANTLRKIAVL